MVTLREIRVKFVKKKCMNETVCPKRRRRKDRVKEYKHERGADRRRGIGQARRECVDRKRWKLFCCEDVKASETIHR